MTDCNRLYDEENAAFYLGGDDSPISPRTLQRWRLEGVGPTFVKLGRLVRYRQRDLELFLDECARTSTSMTSNAGQSRMVKPMEAGNV